MNDSKAANLAATFAAPIVRLSVTEPVELAQAKNWLEAT